MNKEELIKWLVLALILMAGGWAIRYIAIAAAFLILVYILWRCVIL
jgi:hypothetical protein